MDTSKLSPQEQRLYKLYGKLPSRTEILLNKKLKGSDRKFFDSGDYALSKAGKSTDAAGGKIDSDIVEKKHADPQDIPHHSLNTDDNSDGSPTGRSNSIVGIDTSLNPSSSSSSSPLSPSSSVHRKSISHSPSNSISSQFQRRPSSIETNPSASLSTVMPPRSPHAVPDSLRPGDPSLSVANGLGSPATAEVRESSSLLNSSTNETKND